MIAGGFRTKVGPISSIHHDTSATPFGATAGQRLRQAWATATLERPACKRIGLEGFRLHDLRHALVTELFRSGASAPVVQKLAGHQHLKTTQRYAHRVLLDLTAAVLKLSW